MFALPLCSARWTPQVQFVGSSEHLVSGELKVKTVERRLPMMYLNRWATAAQRVPWAAAPEVNISISEVHLSSSAHCFIRFPELPSWSRIRHLYGAQGEPWMHRRFKFIILHN